MYLEDITEAIEKEMIEEICRSFGDPNFELFDNVAYNLTDAMTAYENSCGSIYDFDRLVKLSRILGFHVSYELFSYLDDIYTEEKGRDILELKYCDRDRKEVMEYCKEYMERKNVKAIV